MTAITNDPTLGDLLKYEEENLYSRDQVTVVNGQNLKLGAVIGRVSATQKVKALDPSATDGSEVAAGVVLQSIDASAAEKTNGPSVYGNCRDFPLSENTADLQPISFYGSTKLANEFLASKLNKQSETNILGLRFFSVYGPWGRPDMAYFKILHALYTGKEFNIFGSGSHIRDMTHVWDVVKTISLLQEKNLSDRLSAPDIVNVGGGHPHSLNHLIKTLETASGLDLKRKIHPASALDVNRTEADFSRLQMMINFKPQIDIEQGAQTLIEWASDPKVTKYLKDWSD